MDRYTLIGFGFIGLLVAIMVALAILPQPYPTVHYVDPCPGHHIKNLCD